MRLQQPVQVSQCASRQYTALRRSTPGAAAEYGGHMGLQELDPSEPCTRGRQYWRQYTAAQGTAPGAAPYSAATCASSAGGSGSSGAAAPPDGMLAMVSLIIDDARRPFPAKTRLGGKRPLGKGYWDIESKLGNIGYVTQGNIIYGTGCAVDPRGAPSRSTSTHAV